MILNTRVWKGSVSTKFIKGWQMATGRQWNYDDPGCQSALRFAGTLALRPSMRVKMDAVMARELTRPCIHPPEHVRQLDEYPNYGVSADGLVWSRMRGMWKALALTSNGSGYLKVKVIDEAGNVQTKKVHVLVASVFLGIRPAGLDINHKDGNKANNGIENLEYVTHSQNMRHAIDVLGIRPGRRANGHLSS